MSKEQQAETRRQVEEIEGDAYHHHHDPSDENELFAQDQVRTQDSTMLFIFTNIGITHIHAQTIFSVIKVPGAFVVVSNICHLRSF